MNIQVTQSKDKYFLDINFPVALSPEEIWPYFSTTQGLQTWFEQLHFFPDRIEFIMPGYHEKYPIHQFEEQKIIQFDWDIARVSIELADNQLLFREEYPKVDLAKVTNDFAGWTTHMERLEELFNGRSLPEVNNNRVYEWEELILKDLKSLS